MLFELTTGRRLFKGQSEFETLKLICEREYPRPSEVRPGYPPGLEAIVMKALAKNKDERYQTAREMQSALEDFVRAERIPVSNVALTQYMQSLFEEKLQAQKEQLLQGKQLADIIERDRPSETLMSAEGGEPSTRLSSSLLSAPSAARTLTEIRSVRRTSPLKVTAITAILTGAVLAGAFALHAARKKAAAVVVAPPPPVAVAARGQVSLTSDPPGATIWVDGEMRTDVTPAQVAQLPLGRAIEVKLTKDGFESVKQTFTLTEGTTSANWDAKLSKGSVALDVTLNPPVAGAVLLLDGKKLAGTNGSELTSGDQHKLIVGAPGYVDQTFTFIGNPLEKKHFDVTLQKESHHTHVYQSSGATVTPQPAAPVGTGKLNVGVSPGWCNVTVDGVARGATPVAGIELPAGNHRVVCTAPDHAPMSANVTVPADGTARYRFSLP